MSEQIYYLELKHLPAWMVFAYFGGYSLRIGFYDTSNTARYFVSLVLLLQALAVLCDFYLKKRASK